MPRTTIATTKGDPTPGTPSSSHGRRTGELQLVAQAAALLALGAGLVAHNVMPFGLRTFTATLVATAGALLAWVGFEYSRPRKRRDGKENFQRWHVALTALLTGGGACVTIMLGPNPWWVVFHVIAGATLAGTWWVWRLDSVRGDGRDAHPKTAGWDEVVGLPGARVQVVEDGPDHKRLRITAAGGQDGEDVAQNAKRIQAVIPGALTGSVRAVPSPGGLAVQKDVILMKRDVLATPPPCPPWDGVRRSFADGLDVGVCEDGSRVTINLMGRGLPPTNLQVMGMSRGGKSHLFRLAVLQMSRCSDVVLWLSDTIKAAQTTRPLMPVIDWFAGTRQETAQMLTALDKVTRYRADWLGERGIDEWHPECGLPVLVVWIEEAARVLGDSEKFVRLVESVLSTGVLLVNSMQRASHDNLPTSARANIAANICFPVRSDIDAGFVLPDDVMETQQATYWGSDLENHRGYFLAVAPGITAQQRPMSKRTYWMPGDEILTEITANAGGMPPLDSGSAAAAGKAYADRTAGRDVTPMRMSEALPILQDLVRSGEVKVGPGITGWPTPDDELDDSADYDADADEELEAIKAEVDIHPEDTADMAQIDPRAALPQPTGPNIAFPQLGTPGPKLSGRARREAWLATFKRVAQASPTDDDGNALVAMEALLDAWYLVPGVDPTTRPWVSQRMSDLCEAGGAERLMRGEYRVFALANFEHPMAEGDDSALLSETG